MRNSVFTVSVSVALLLGSHPAESAEFGGCKFNSATLAFKGSTETQIACLLRKVKPKGSGATVQVIPQWLLDHVTKDVELSADRLSAYLSQTGIGAADLGGSVAKGDASELRYFVIHDTSFPEETGSFPGNIDQADYRGNKLGNFNAVRKKVHLIISRDGRSRAFNDWKVVREEPGVKIETNSRVPKSRKLFAHVENVQPRIKPANSFAWIAPDPGFSPKQQERLALAYIAASMRAGQWLIPAYHFNIDEGLPNGHDDPQNANLAGWVQDIARLHDAIAATSP